MATATTVPQTQSVKAPAGYSEEKGDITGFWDPQTGPIHMIPRSVRLFDSKVDATKVSALLYAELIDPCTVVADLATKETTIAKKGDLVGVWLKPGMKALANLGGVPAYMYEDGVLDTGKPNPMTVFKVMRKSRGAQLPVEADFRSRSKAAPLPVPVVLMAPADASADKAPPF